MNKSSERFGRSSLQSGKVYVSDKDLLVVFYRECAICNNIPTFKYHETVSIVGIDKRVRH